MGWKILFHDDCVMPTSDRHEGIKDKAKPGSIWQCGSTGCNRTYSLLPDNTWVEVQELGGYRTKDDPDQFILEDSVAAIVADKERYEAQQAYERTRALNDRTINTLHKQVAELTRQLNTERNKTLWERMRGL